MVSDEEATNTAMNLNQNTRTSKEAVNEHGQTAVHPKCHPG